jgi:hypothetical protein
VQPIACKNRCYSKRQSSAVKRWLDARQADLRPLEYYHVIFTLPAPIAAVALQNKAAVNRLLSDIAAEVLSTMAAADKPGRVHRRDADSAYLRFGVDAPPNVHGIVPGGGLSADGKRWVVVGRRSSCLCGCCHGCSTIAPSKSCCCISWASCSSSASTPRWLTPKPSRSG